MSSVSQNNNTYAPNVPPEFYSDEKANFAGILVCAVFFGMPTYASPHSSLPQSIYQGITIVLFFRCMSALLDPANRTSGGIKWLLMAHTVAIFLFVTVFTAINLDIMSISYVDNRGAYGLSEPSGPLSYQHLSYSTPIGIISTCMFLLNNWLVDGLLVRFVFNSAARMSNVGLQLYRCYMMYSMNTRVIIFPCLLYFATCGTCPGPPQNLGHYPD